MIQIIGVIEVLIFYVAYFLKLFNQREKGIKTNQLGIGVNVNEKVYHSLTKLFTTSLAK